MLISFQNSFKYKVIIALKSNAIFPKKAKLCLKIIKISICFYIVTIPYINIYCNPHYKNVPIFDKNVYFSTRSHHFIIPHIRQGLL